MFDWFDNPIDSRAHKGGELGVDGVERKGGEFLPFYVPRPEMPQIDEVDLPGFRTFCFEQDVKLTEMTLPTDELRFHQRVDKMHASGMPAEVLAKPCLVSAEGYILDGNHRATEHKMLGTPCPVIRVELDFEAAIKLMFSYPKTYCLVPGVIRD